MNIIKGDILHTNSHGDVKVTDVAEDDNLLVVTKDLEAPAGTEELFVINCDFQVVFNYSEIERTANA